MGQMCDGQAVAADMVADVMCGALSVDGRSEGEDDFLYVFFRAARNKRLKVEIVRPDTVQCGQYATKNMVKPLVGCGSFNRPEIADIIILN